MSVVMMARKNAKLHHFNGMSDYNKKIEDYFSQKNRPHSASKNPRALGGVKETASPHSSQGLPLSQGVALSQGVGPSQKEKSSQQGRDSPLLSSIHFRLGEDRLTPLKSINSSLMQRTIGSQRSLLMDIEGGKAKSGRKSRKKEKRGKKGRNMTLEKYFIPSSSKKTISEEQGESEEEGPGRRLVRVKGQ